MSESLRNDGRVWVPRNPGDTTAAQRHSRIGAGLLPGGKVSQFRQPGAAGRGLPQRQGAVRPGQGGRRNRTGGLPRFCRRHPAGRPGDDRQKIRQPVSRCTKKSPAQNPYETPMMIYPAVHYTMGGLWVDYNLMSTVPGLFVLGRGQLLRPRRQPPRRQRPDAGTGRRLFRHPLHHRRLSGRCHAR